MTHSDGKIFVAGQGFVERPQEVVAPPCDTEPQTDESAYLAQREAAHMAKIGASMDRALGRQPTDLPGLKTQRTILGDTAPARSDNRYDPLAR